MVAYVVGEVTVTDGSWVKEYGAKIQHSIEQHGGRFIARGSPDEKLEGNRILPDSLVIIEFPTVDFARAWYHDPDYKPLITLRQTGSTCEIMLIDGAQ